ncbi:MULTISPECIES: ribonuclease P protein component [Azospirillum]|uniref:Ribonuclease P protein component n=1 Tax=Azospirillum brasilense TaxID=192 RepID=A0A0P0EEC0_AZOBR|nr:MULTISPECIES: ribonuclease P protein component [Azospirillum]ALJ36158.1 ribonuclease P protein component [Azospirillum brasilense]MDW7552594.1 ribonuclease P protein component [Azospirillum brasilense]MDW7592214.1 ribonuclease P protein component [Azospirillum brasilense]MDW7627345.1 ribonuclease P protein component [Azospirillum brasilense]MDX5954966.1 ribonuclease P protein component [Azospirillum brasilense]
MAAPDPRVGRLKRRPEFLAVAGTRRKHVAPGLILQVRRHDERQRPAPGEPPIRLGLTASRKVGNAVVRNRARRRLREAARQILTAHAAPGHDFVLVARAATAERPWTELVGDLIAALKRLGLWRDVSKGDASRNEVNGGPNAVTSNGGTGNGSGGGEVGA